MSNVFTSILGAIAFAAVLLSTLADLVLAATWTKFYFTSGALVFRQQVSIESRHSNTPLPSLLEKRFSSCWMGSFTFKELESNQYGFRQKFFSFTLNPVTHGFIVFDAENNLVTVKGYLNWHVISFTILLLIILPFIWLIGDSPRAEFLDFYSLCMVICGLLFGIPYLMDRSRLTMIAATAVELWSRKYVSNHERA